MSKERWPTGHSSSELYKSLFDLILDRRSLYGHSDASPLDVETHGQLADAAYAATCDAAGKRLTMPRRMQHLAAAMVERQVDNFVSEQGSNYA